MIKIAENGDSPTYMLYSSDPSILREIKTKLELPSLTITEERQSELTTRDSKQPKLYLMCITTFQMKQKKINHQSFRDELTNKNAVLLNGHSERHPEALVIDFSQKQPELTVEVFKKEYQKQYQSEFFKNPFSTMKKRLAEAKEITMKEIENYANEHPTSRTARVLKQLR